MSERTSVQWRRLVMESIAILLSILVAFAIDAAWDARRERAEEAEILQALRKDFLANQLTATDVVQTHGANAALYAVFASLTPTEVMALPQDSLDVITRSMSGPYTFDPVRGTIDALIGAGKLGLIRNRPLREALVTFLNLVDDAREDAEFLGRAAERVWAKEVLHGGPWSASAAGKFEIGNGRAAFLDPIDRETLAGVRTDVQMMGLIKQFHATAATYSSEVARVVAQIDSVLVLLQGSDAE
ncbi:MAG: hypothetical protein ACC682_13505 [Gemmatimonadota bacterium]